MLSLPEYTALKAELGRLGTKYEAQIGAQGLTSPDQVYPLAREYWNEYTRLLDNGMREIAESLHKHYADNLGGISDKLIIDEVLDDVWKDPYYGATLQQRLDWNFHALIRRIYMSGTLNSKHLQTVWSQAPMFGSQTAVDQRLLLGTVASIENLMAKKFAEHTEHKLIRWTLSHRHKQTDECDDLANYVDPKVVEYISVNELKMSPKGVYFSEDLPLPPHPNCQCEYGMVKGNRYLPPTRVERAIRRVQHLLRRITGK